MCLMFAILMFGVWCIFWCAGLFLVVGGLLTVVRYVLLGVCYCCVRLRRSMLVVDC